MAWRTRWPDITGYVWLGARYYNPESGGFLSTDPIWNGRDPNYYSFCGGDPINRFDADGRFGKAVVNYGYQNGIYGGDFRAAAQYFHNLAGATDNSYLGAGAEFLGDVANMGAANTTPASYVNQATSDYASQGGGTLGVAGALNRYNPTKPIFDLGSGIDMIDAHQLSGVERTSAGLNVFGSALLAGAGAFERPPVPQEIPPVIPLAPESGAFENYMRQAQTLDIATAENGAVFYSGHGNRLLAEQFAEQNGRLTLEKTPGGSWLDQQGLFNAGSPLSRDQAVQVWSVMSERFAQGASGSAVGFVNGARAGSIFNTVEYPTLLNNRNIVNVITGGH
jgi:RHS repeat-associated protein